jgi:hypothetical protein
MADQVQGIRRFGIVGVYYSTVCGSGESAIRHMYVEEWSSSPASASLIHTGLRQKLSPNNVPSLPVKFPGMVSVHDTKGLLDTVLLRGKSPAA